MDITASSLWGKRLQLRQRCKRRTELCDRRSQVNFVKAFRSIQDATGRIDQYEIWNPVFRKLTKRGCTDVKVRLRLVVFAPEFIVGNGKGVAVSFIVARLFCELYAPDDARGLCTLYGQPVCGF